MSLIIENFHFIRPLCLLLLAPAAILLFLMYRLNSSNSTWSNYIDKNLLPYLLSSSTSSLSRFNVFLVAAVLLLTILALAGPTWVKKPVAVQKDENALVIVWDLSPSMYVSDIKPSRLERSKFKIIELLRQRKQGLTGLVVYSEQAHVVTPMTDDVNTIVNLLGGLQPSVMPGYGSNIEMAQAEAIKLLADAGIQKGHILILTDGIDASAKNELAEMQRTVPHRLSIWGVGTAEGAPIPISGGGFAKDRNGEIVLPQLDHELMQEIAQDTGALYIPFSQDDLDINTIIGFALDRSEQNFTETEREFDQWQEAGPYLLLPLVLLFPFLFRRGWLVCFLVATPLLTPEKALAFNIDDLLLTKDQKAQKAFNQGNVEAAAETFENTQWKAASHYKAGDYESAASLYANKDDAQSAYNRGNALAKQRQYSQALEAYEKVLAINPDHKKAQENYKLVKEFLDSLPQDSENQQNSDQENSEQNKQDQQNSEKQSQDGNQSESGENANNNSESENQNTDSESSESQSKQQNSDNQESSNSKSEEKNKDDSKFDPSSSEAKDGDKLETENSNSLDQDIKEKLDQKYQEDEATSEQDNQSEAAAPEENNIEPSDTPSNALIDPKAEAQNREQFELERQLNKIPDNPGELLRRKFAQQRKERNIRGRSAPRRSAPGDEQRW